LLGIYLNGADFLDERIALRLIGPDDGNLDPKHVSLIEKRMNDFA
jgi:hypothetical protein